MTATHRTRVKICGLACACDARAAVEAGADALGVLLAPGHRRSVTLAQAAEVFAGVPPFVARVGVFVDPTMSQVEEAVARLRLNAVQLHGAEDEHFCARVPVPVIKAVRVGGGVDRATVERYAGCASAVLLDTLVAGAAGGSGVTFRWDLARGLRLDVPLVLAGGLHADNVGEAIRALRPFAVDVSSGVEESCGVKSARRIEEFMAAVRAADEETRSQTDE